jgi:triacylglycerol lipase
MVERMAIRSARSHYRSPEAVAASIGRDPAGPLVLLITGSMIVADFFEVMAARLEREGFRPLVYQPPDLFTTGLEAGARNINEAVKTILARAGEEKLLIVAECNGGVASRYWMEQLGGDRYIDRLVTFVSAHHGTGAVGVRWCTSLGDIKPGSAYLETMDTSRPPEGGPLVISIYLRNDEIMRPCTTSRLEGALNIEVRDDGMDARARKRKPARVHHLVGDALARLYPVHLAGFWDEQFFRLIVSCLKDDPDAIREFDDLKISVD